VHKLNRFFSFITMNKVEIINKLSEETFHFLSAYTHLTVVVDENTKQHCYPLVEKYLPPHSFIEIQSGEERKNLDTCTIIWDALTEQQFDRKSAVLNLGGGVIGDMGGFCAATYKRGIDFVQMPTTLLAQVDASVGGKLGIDFHGFKNHIGVFQIPKTVLVYPHFLRTLSERELRSGFAEVIKHSLIADKAHWEKIAQLPLTAQNWETIIPHSIQIKSDVVESDPTEKGLRKILNFGHTIGHAIETFALSWGENRLLHGEAIAIGMICEAYLSHKKLGLPELDLKQIEQYILQLYGKVKLDEKDFPSIFQNALQDKKNERNSIRCVLLPEIGKAQFDVKIGKEDITDGIRYYLEKKVLF